MNRLFLNFITIVHVFIIFFIIITPFTNINYLLTLHVLIVPFIMFHWILNNNTCCLTLAEKQIRKKLKLSTNKEECFTCQLIEPIYDFNNDKGEFSIFIYTITIILWFISVSKLYNKYKTGEINSYFDFLKI